MQVVQKPTPDTFPIDDELIEVPYVRQPDPSTAAWATLG